MVEFLLRCLLLKLLLIFGYGGFEGSLLCFFIGEIVMWFWNWVSGILIEGEKVVMLCFRLSLMILL